ncbi:autophagy-related protein 9B isoform X2 [Pantherophis guttatus]|uniref:Autophagy-related protein 9 n=1 Tax=Pantherophis guttatus TaxID=94885 RepID=A0ABM3ZMV0_PANGU|nr:autophagy-related protein 9B isoform X2 [Pantherophis guttatus]
MAGSQELSGEYHPLPVYEDEDDEELLVHVTEGLKDSWHHIKNLDNFFTKIYHFHQRNGFGCMMLSDVFELVQFLFVATFSTFLLCCVEYDILFANQPVNHTHPGAGGRGFAPDRGKVTLPDAILPAAQCAERIQANSGIIFLLVMAATFWLYRLVKVLCSLLSYWEIRSFYTKALKIPSEQLCNCSWQEVQARLISLQREQQLCVHRRELTELDIHHRILRFKNYLVAMVNKSLLPIRFQLPLLGRGVFLTQGLKYNLELLLFWGPGSLFQGKWNLQPQYKRAGARLELARQLERSLLLLGVANLLLCPFILVWQGLYAFFSYTEALKREPGSLGARRWSLYGRLYLRHFNELDHELQARLSHGYKPASKYMNSFANPLLAVVARNVGFFAGSLLAVLIALTVYDEDVLTVQHILTAITLLGLVVTLARAFIPDEHLVWCPEQLLQCVLAHIHYIPDHWQGNAHKSETREELAQLFQYKAVFILEELLSPIVTPFLLIFALRAKALEIVDFFRNFSVEVVGVGDICSFAQLDIRNHGNPQWLSQGRTEASVYQQAENGKTELSLVHFAIANPHWQPPPESSLFIGHLKEKVQQDASHAQRLLAEGPLAASLLSDEGPGPVPDALLASVLTHPVLAERRLVAQPGSTASVTASILASLSSSQPSRHRSRPGEASVCNSQSPLLENSTAPSAPRPAPLSRSVLLSELASAEMSLHALYMHELHQQQAAARLAPQPSAQTASPPRLFDSRSQDRSLEVWEEESDETQQQQQQPEKS